MNEEKTIKISVTLNTEPLEKALGKANDLVEVINFKRLSLYGTRFEFYTYNQRETGGFAISNFV